jgi:hypothetical protein
VHPINAALRIRRCARPTSLSAEIDELTFTCCVLDRNGPLPGRQPGAVIRNPAVDRAPQPRTGRASERAWGFCRSGRPGCDR